MQRTSSMRSQMLVATSGSQSLAKPGSMPLTNSDTPPSAAAASTPAYIASGHRAPRVLEEHRARRHDVDAGPQEPLQVGERLEQPVVGPGGVHDAVGPQGQQRRRRRRVAATPSVRSRPASLPASMPTLAGLDTHTPTSSRSGRASMPAMAWRPTLPVLHCTTR